MVSDPRLVPAATPLRTSGVRISRAVTMSWTCHQLQLFAVLCVCVCVVVCVYVCVCVCVGYTLSMREHICRVSGALGPPVARVSSRESTSRSGTCVVRGGAGWVSVWVHVAAAIVSICGVLGCVYALL